MSVELRLYQKKMVSDINTAWNMGYKNIAGVMPTGSGKSVVISALVKQHQGACVVLAHRMELVVQMSLHLTRDGIRHRIIANASIIKMCVRMQHLKYDKVLYDSQANVAVASVQTIVRRGKQLERYLPTVSFWVVDECFPAGTIVDDKKIETINVGDYVQAFNEKIGSYQKRKVIRTFKNIKPNYMVRLETESRHVVESTKGHPFWTKRGWVNAGDLTIDDEVLIYEQNNIQRCSLQSLREDNKRSGNKGKSTVQIQEGRFDFLRQRMRVFLQKCSWKETSKRNSAGKLSHLSKGNGYFRQSVKLMEKFRQSLLQQGMLKGVCESNIIRDNDKNKLEVCQGENVKKQSYEKRGNSKESIRNFKKNRASTKDKRREWQGSNSTGEKTKGNVSRLWFQITNNCKDWLNRSFNGLSDSLQNRLWSQRFKDSDRSRRIKSSHIETTETRCEKRQVSYWSRVDSVEIFKSDNTGKSKESYVYNIEVDEHHTYVANGITVHNCHHLQKGNVWGTAVQMFTRKDCKGLGVTATPIRSDGGGLSRKTDGLLDYMVEGPTMRDLINQGNLSEYKIFAPGNDINFSNVKISKSTGDYNKLDIANAVNESSLISGNNSTVTGDIVANYLKFAKGKLGITFVPNMEIGHEITAQYNSVGVNAELINAKTPDDVRAGVLTRFANRELLQLVNVNIFSEGFDCPAVEVVSMGRPSMSLSMVFQQFGRALRPLPGKTYAMIIDHVGNIVGRHGLPDAVRVWSLDRRDKRATAEEDDGVIPVKSCPMCSLVYERYKKACPECGYIPEPTNRNGPEYVDGDLTELDPQILAIMRKEVENVGRSVAEHVQEYREQLEANHCKPMYAAGHAKRYATKIQHQHDSQATLRDHMAWYAGFERNKGHTDDEIMRIFYLKYHVDWLSAQALPGIETDNLLKRMDGEYYEH